MTQDLCRWAEARDIAVLVPPQYPRHRASAKARRSLGDVHPFPSSPCVDYGRYLARRPRFVLRPRTVDQVRRCVVWLADRRLPFKVRGGAHSTGGQVLIEGGAVLDLSGLDAMGRLDARRRVISAQAGCAWRPLAVAAREAGMRLPVMPDNLDLTVAGTLSVGGFGYTSPFLGLQADGVEALTVLTLDGELHRVRRGDPLFDYTLAGRGQLGIILEIRQRLLRSSPVLTWRRLVWRSLRQHVRDMKVLIAEGYYDYARALITDLRGDQSVRAIVGRFTPRDRFDDRDTLRDLAAEPASSPGAVDLATINGARPFEIGNRPLTGPALEFVLPLDRGLAIWDRIRTALASSTLPALIPGGTPPVVVLHRRRDRLPLSPVPDTEHAILFVLRPQVPWSQAQAAVEELRGIGLTALAAGGRIYLMSVDVGGPRFLERQFGAALPRLLRLKRRFDPHGLLNPGLLDGASALA